MASSPGTVLCLIGPTAVGKTGLIGALAGGVPMEVISLDSRQIYRGLPVGTAQPSAGDLAACPHHLCGFLPIDQTYDAAKYRRDFAAAYQDITGRGGVPVVVGGAGLYLTAVAEGFLPLPEGAGDRLPEIRAMIDGLSDAQVFQRLHKADPDSAVRIHPNDLYRARRALEIHQLTGRPMTELMAHQLPDPVLGLRFEVHLLERPVAELDEIIARRAGLMLAGGWIEETAAALEKFPPEAPGLQSIGYPQIVRLLAGESDATGTEADIVRVTRQYAKRQRTWFRKTATAGRGHPDDRDFRRFLLNRLRDLR